MNQRISAVVNNAPSTKVGAKFFDGTSWTQYNYGDLRNDIKLTSDFFLKLTNGGRQLLGFCVSPSLSLPALILSATLSSCPFVFLDHGLSHTLLKKLGVRWLLAESPVNDKRFKFSQSFEVRSKQKFMVYSYVDVPANIKIKENEHYLYAATTSGSTGVPKVIRVPEESILPNVLDFCSKIGLSANKGILLCTALTFDPAILEFYLAILKEAPLIIVSKDVTRNPKLLWRAIKEGEVGFYQTTPSLFKQWNIGQKRCLVGRGSPLEALVLGGERFPTCEEIKTWQPKQNVAIYNTYGLTEVSCWATLNLAFPNDNWKNFSDFGLDIGEPLSETLMISTKDPSDELHHLMIGSSTRVCAVEDENFGEIKSSQPVFRFTGDFFKIVDGKYYFCHRNDSTVKRLGKKVNVASIEEKCQEVGLDAAISVRYSDDLNDIRLFMFIVENKDAGRIPDKIRSLKKILPEDHWPDGINFVDSLPVTSHGKLDRKALECVFFDIPESNFSTFANLWNRFTNGSSTGENPGKGFVASGGNSYTAVLFINSLKESGFPEHQDLLLSLLKDEPFAKCWEMIQKKLPKAKKQKFTRRKKKVKNKIENPLPSEKSLLKVAPSAVISKLKEEPSFMRFEPPVDIKALTPCEESLPQQTVYMALKGRVCPQNSSIVHPVWTTKSHNIQELWSVDLLKCIDASPLAVMSHNSENNFLIVGSHSGLVAVLKCDTGEKISQTQLPDRVEASACLSSDHSFYYIGCYDGNIYRICIADGKVIWIFKTQDQIKSACVLHHRKLFVGSYDKNVYALSEGGDLLWKRSVGPVTIPVLPYESSIIVGTLTNLVWRLRSEDGTVMTKVELSSPLFSNFDFMVFPGDQSCVLMCPVEGPILWKEAETFCQVHQYEIQGHVYASPVAASDELTIISSGNTVHCLHFQNKVWTCELKHRIVSTPFVVGLCVVVITVDGTLHLIDENGVLLRTYSFPGEVFSSPVVVGSRVYVGCRDNHFYCLNVC